MKKNAAKESWYIFSIVMLSVLLILSLYLFLQNPFITNAPVTSGLTSLGTPINLQLESVGTGARSLFFHGSVLPDSKVLQDVKITLKANQPATVARGKVVLFDEFGAIVPITVFTASNWTQNQDGYFYCQEQLSANLVLDFLTAVQIPSAEYGLNPSNIYAMMIIVETLPASSNFQELWG